MEGILADIAKGTSPYVPDACMPSEAAVPGYMVGFALLKACTTTAHTLKKLVPPGMHKV